MIRTSILLLASFGWTAQLYSQSDFSQVPAAVLAQNQGTQTESQLPPIVEAQSGNSGATQSGTTQTGEPPIVQPPRSNTSGQTTDPTTPGTTDTPPATNPAGTDAANPNANTNPPPTSPRRRVAPPAIMTLSMASIPNMIGDTTGGGCASLTVGPQLNRFMGPNQPDFNNSLSDLNIGHPTLACGRLNISENNSPVLHDRFYMNYRHFHNTSQMDVFNTEPIGGSSDFHTDRLTIGAERRIGLSSSIELRVPVNYQMNSELVATRTGVTPMLPVTNLPLGDYAFEVGNIGLIYKVSLIEREQFYLSGGVGTNLPTAPDVSTTSIIDDDAFPVGFGTADIDLVLNSRFRNDTVNITPFIASVYRPNQRWFTQGFLQCDIPANSSRHEITRDLTVNGTMLPTLNVSNRIEQQTVLRVNAGIGRWLRRGRQDAIIQSMAIMFETHYTTTLNDAQNAPVEIAPDIGNGPTILNLGNANNRIDVVDLSMGLPMVIGNFNVNPGVAVPITTGPNRSFDFEASLAIDRRY